MNKRLFSLMLAVLFCAMPLLGYTYPGKIYWCWPWFGGGPWNRRYSETTPSCKISKTSLRWRKKGHPNDVIYSSPVVGKLKNGKTTIFVVGTTKAGKPNSKATIYCYDLNGSLLWSRSFKGEKAQYTAPALNPFPDKGCRVYLCTKKKSGSTYQGILRCLDAEAKGKVLWTYNLGSPYRETAPIIDWDDTIYLGGSKGTFHAVKSNGKPKWAPLKLLKPNAYVCGSAAFNVPNVCFTTDQGEFYAVSGQTGKPLQGYPYNLKNVQGVTSSVAIGKYNAYFVTDKNVLVGMPLQGSLKPWFLPIKGLKSTKSPIIASPAVMKPREFYYKDDLVITTRGDGKKEFGRLYTISADAKGGKITWSGPIGKEGTYSSPIMTGDGYAYVCTWDKGMVHKFDLVKKKTWGTYQLPKYSNGLYPNIHSSPAIGPHSYLYFGATDGFLYSLGVKASTISTGVPQSGMPNETIPLPDDPEERLNFLVEVITERMDELSQTHDPEEQYEIEKEITQRELELLLLEKEMLPDPSEWFLEELDREIEFRKIRLREFEEEYNRLRLHECELVIDELWEDLEWAENPAQEEEIWLEILRLEAEIESLIRILEDGSEE